VAKDLQEFGDKLAATIVQRPIPWSQIVVSVLEWCDAEVGTIGDTLVTKGSVDLATIDIRWLRHLSHHTGVLPAAPEWYFLSYKISLGTQSVPIVLLRRDKWSSKDDRRLLSILPWLQVAWQSFSVSTLPSSVSNLSKERVLEERLQGSLQLQSKLYEKNRQYVEQLQRANQLKDDFISTVSHELRTPLTAMLLAIKMLRHPSLDLDRRQKYLDILSQQCDREIKLVNDLLNIKKLDSTVSEDDSEWIDINDLLNRLVGNKNKDIGELSDQQPINLKLHITKIKIFSNRESCERIFQELLDNAVKYARLGTKIEIEIEPIKLPIPTNIDNLGNGTIVKFTNIGDFIPPTDIPLMFDRFRRGDDATKKAIAGTGLGLALVKSLVRYIHGNIEASSHPLEDNSAIDCFTVTLPTLKH
jgi:signal transduction histidine kinase